MKSKLASLILAESYTLLRKLGEGTFASVYEARNNQSSEKVAIKQVYVQKALIDEAMDEVDRLKQLDNDHIISYRDSFYDSQEFYLNLVMELCHDSLRGLMQDKKLFSTRQLQSFLIQMTCVFLQLESKHIMHLDLKPQNILVANKERSYYKLCDFGCSQLSDYSKMSGYEVTAFGTFNYLAPQMHVSYEGEKTRNSADVWSLGVTLYEMIFWRLPFSKEANGTVSRKQIEQFFKKNTYAINFDAGPDAPKYIIQIVKLMLKPLPTQRISWKHLKDRIIKDLNVQMHQFLNIKDLIVNFLKIFELLVKTSKILRQGCESAAPFWKSNNEAALKMYEQFVHYIHIIGFKFRERQSYRWQITAVAQRQAAERLIQQAQQMQTAICKKKQIRQFDSSDFSYQQCVTADQMKAFNDRIKAQGKLQAQLEFLYNVFSTLRVVIQKSLGVFNSLEIFEACFKIKI